MAKERAKPEIAADRPPPFLSPFMDCVEGAGCAPEGDYPGTRWLLYRNGEVVGDIRVPWTNHPYPSGDRGPKL